MQIGSAGRRSERASPPRSQTLSKRSVAQRRSLPRSNWRGGERHLGPPRDLSSQRAPTHAERWLPTARGRRSCSRCSNRPTPRPRALSALRPLARPTTRGEARRMPSPTSTRPSRRGRARARLSQSPAASPWPAWTRPLRSRARKDGRSADGACSGSAGRRKRRRRGSRARRSISGPCTQAAATTVRTIGLGRASLPTRPRSGRLCR